MTEADKRQFEHSSYREMVVEALFISSLLKHLWEADGPLAEVMYGSVDNSGYDVAIECNSVLRHVQFKVKIGRGPILINKRLSEKPSGCVILMIVDRKTLAFKKFLWLGGKPGEGLRLPSDCNPACHPRRNVKGVRPKRMNTLKVRRGKFEPLKDIATVAERLFGWEGRAKMVSELPVPLLNGRSSPIKQNEIQSQ